MDRSDKRGSGERGKGKQQGKERARGERKVILRERGRSNERVEALSRR